MIEEFILSDAYRPFWGAIVLILFAIAIVLIFRWFWSEVRG